jgi:hypothetical protein
MIVQKVAWSEDVIDAAVSLARLSCVSRSLHDAIVDSEGWKAFVQLHFGVNFSTSKRAAAMFKQWYSFAREVLAIFESKHEEELNDELNVTALDDLPREELLAIHLRVKNDEFTVAEAKRRFGLMVSQLRFLDQLRKEELPVFDRLREEQLTLAEVEQIYHEADLKDMHREAWLDTRYRPPALTRLFRLLDVLQTVQRKHGSMVPSEPTG